MKLQVKALQNARTSAIALGAAVISLIAIVFEFVQKTLAEEQYQRLNEERKVVQSLQKQLENVKLKRIEL